MGKFLGWIATLFVLGVLAGGGVLFGIFYHYGKGLPDCEQLAAYTPPVVSRLYASDGQIFAEYGAQKRIFVPISAIPTHIISTVLAAEDKNFYTHWGVDVGSILRAVATNLSNWGKQKRPVGASTITQQVAKNFLLTSHEVSLERKIKEAILAFRLEKAFSKNKILELYLNEIYLGNGAYGIAAAALSYFNKSLEELTIEEAAFLAGLPKAPSKYDPTKAPRLAKARRDWVIGRMREDGIITFEDEIYAKRMPLILNPADVQKNISAPYFSENVRRQLVQKYGEKNFYEQGLAIRTSLNPEMQKIAEKALFKGLVAYDRRHGWRGTKARVPVHKLKDWQKTLLTTPLSTVFGPWKQAVVLSIPQKGEAEIGLASGKKGKILLEDIRWARKNLPGGELGPAVHSVQNVLDVGDIIFVSQKPGSSTHFFLEQAPQVEGGIVALDPQTGRIFALVGGSHFQNSQFDRTTQAFRQAGSAFKPFVYLAALEKGLSPTTIINDSPISVSLGSGLGVYSPQNITKQFYGPTPLRVGLEKSRNVVTVRLASELVGMKRIATLAEKFNLTRKMPLQLAMALGAGETTLLSLTAAYGMIANGGRRITPTLIDLIHDRNGHILWRADRRQCLGCLGHYSDRDPPVVLDEREQLADPISLYQLTSILEGVIQRGTGTLLKELKRPLAGKTGTSNNYRDAWFIGFSPELVVGVFVGFDDFRTLGDKETGARVALPIFLSFMKDALHNIPPTPFPIPPGIKFIPVNAVTGLPAQSQDKNIIFEALRDEEIFEDNLLETTKRKPQAPEIQAEKEQKNQSATTELSPAVDTAPLTGTGGIY